MANQFLSLALFLMLLSFFIVMNAMSNFESSEEKQAPVLNSLARAFSNQVIEVRKAPVPEAASSSAIREGDTLEVLEGLFNAHISGLDVSKNRLGTIMHVRTAVGEFENAIDVPDIGYAGITHGMQGSFLPSLITLLRSDEIGQPYRMDMVLNISEEPAILYVKTPNEFKKSLKRVSGFAEILEGVGLPENMMSVGLAQGEYGYIDLYFYRYKPFDMYTELQKNGGL